MSDKKNIDTFFKEHLAHFEINPPEMAWENIEAKLNEKKEKRRVIPFWLKFSGIAAILLIGFGLYTTYFNIVFLCLTFLHRCTALVDFILNCKRFIRNK